jgi:hypothetical protein
MSRVPGRREQDTPALMGNALADRRPSWPPVDSSPVYLRRGLASDGDAPTGCGRRPQEDGAALDGSIRPGHRASVRRSGQRVSARRLADGLRSASQDGAVPGSGHPAQGPSGRRTGAARCQVGSEFAPSPPGSTAVCRDQRAATVGLGREPTEGPPDLRVRPALRLVSGTIRWTPSGNLRVTVGRTPPGNRWHGGVQGVLHEVLTRRAGRSRSGLDCPSRDPKGRRRASSEPNPAAQRSRILRDEVPPCGHDRSNAAFGPPKGDRSGKATEEHARKGTPPVRRKIPRRNPRSASGMEQARNGSGRRKPLRA